MKTFTVTSSLLAMTILLSSSSAVVLARGGHRASSAAYGECSKGCSDTYNNNIAACQSQYSEIEKADKKNECAQNVAIDFQTCATNCMKQQ
ncbi:hypothetical protein BG000_002333 [Podila horticola]|nr:hypothetical protein BG000_002333 [Podila horticola]